jgi:energy-coupling factor transporter ATP-binding protein EcfA2
MDKSNPLIYLLGAGSCLLVALHGKQTNIGALSASLGGVILAQTAMSKASDRYIDDEVNVILRNTEISKYVMMAESELTALLPPETQAEIVDVPAQTLPTSTTNNDSRFKDLARLLEMGKGIFLMAGTGCGKSSLVKFFCGEIGNIESLTVCDPHWDGKQDYGVTPYFNYDDILDQLQLAIDELDSRRELRRAGKTFPYKVYVFDEWPSIRIYAEDDQHKKKLCKNALIRLGSECRKYNMLVIFCSQSGNVKAAGLDGMGDFLSNFSCIRIGKNATKYARGNGLKEELQLLQTQAYPCLVDDEVFYHATHGHYQEFKDGQPPVNIKPFTVGNYQEKKSDLDTTGNNIIHTEKGRFDLNKEGASEGSEGEDEGSNEPGPHPDANLLESIFTKGCSDLEPSTLLPDSWAAADPLEADLSAEVRGVLRDLISMNCTKKETIKLVFDATKGGGAKYKAASYWYEEIKAQIK